MTISAPGAAFLLCSVRRVVFLRVMCASCVCVAGQGARKSPRRTQGHGKALKARDALQAYAVVSVVATIQATKLYRYVKPLAAHVRWVDGKTKYTRTFSR